eukprot:140899-Chlamydomonas_euryale.AAC.1
MHVPTCPTHAHACPAAFKLHCGCHVRSTSLHDSRVLSPFRARLDSAPCAAAAAAGAAAL